MTYSEKYRELSENNYRLRAEANRQLTGLYLKLATHHRSPLKDRLVRHAFEAAQQSSFFLFEHEIFSISTCFIFVQAITNEY